MSGKVRGDLERKCDTFEQALGFVITELRVKPGWGYERVARQVGCDPAYMKGIECGRRDPTVDLLWAIAHLHGLTLSRLFLLGERKYKRDGKEK